MKKKFNWPWIFFQFIQSGVPVDSGMGIWRTKYESDGTLKTLRVSRSTDHQGIVLLETNSKYSKWTTKNLDFTLTIFESCNKSFTIISIFLLQEDRLVHAITVALIHPLLPVQDRWTTPNRGLEWYVDHLVIKLILLLYSFYLFSFRIPRPTLNPVRYLLETKSSQRRSSSQSTQWQMSEITRRNR